MYGKVVMVKFWEILHTSLKVFG